MAAATQSARTIFNLGAGVPMFRVTFSSLTSDQPETLSYNYADCPSAAPVWADFRVKTASTNRCVIGMELDVTAANTTNKTVPVRFYAEGGGDIAGAVVDVTLEFAPPGTTVTGIVLAA